MPGQPPSHRKTVHPFVGVLCKSCEAPILLFGGSNFVAPRFATVCQSCRQRAVYVAQDVRRLDGQDDTASLTLI